MTAREGKRSEAVTHKRRWFYDGTGPSIQSPLCRWGDPVPSGEESDYWWDGVTCPRCLRAREHGSPMTVADWKRKPWTREGR
jgi:hypothetical protein